MSNNKYGGDKFSYDSCGVKVGLYVRVYICVYMYVCVHIGVNMCVYICVFFFFFHPPQLETRPHTCDITASTASTTAFDALVMTHSYV